VEMESQTQVSSVMMLPKILIPVPTRAAWIVLIPAAETLSLISNLVSSVIKGLVIPICSPIGVAQIARSHNVVMEYKMHQKDVMMGMRMRTTHVLLLAYSPTLSHAPLLRSVLLVSAKMASVHRGTFPPVHPVHIPASAFLAFALMVSVHNREICR